jgi:succinyl-CoA synthetase alpha subunit
MGHAGAIITGESGRAESKINAFARAGAAIIPSPPEIGATAQAVLRKLGRAG